MVEYELEEWRRTVIAAIKEHGGAHKKISLEAGLGPTFVRDLIKRHQEPGVEKLRKLCKYLGVDFGSLFSKEPKTSEDIAYDIQRSALGRAFKEVQAQPVNIQKLIIEGMRGQLKIVQADQVKSVQKAPRPAARAPQKKAG